MNAYTAEKVGRERRREAQGAAPATRRSTSSSAAVLASTLDGDESTRPQGRSCSYRTPTVCAPRRRRRSRDDVLAIGGRPDKAFEHLRAGSGASRRMPLPSGRLRARRSRTCTRGSRAAGQPASPLPPRLHRGASGPHSTRRRDTSTERSSSIPSTAQVGRRRTRTCAAAQESPGSLSPAASARNAGTGSASGRATTSSAPCVSPPSASHEQLQARPPARTPCAPARRRTERDRRHRRGRR